MTLSYFYKMKTTVEWLCNDKQRLFNEMFFYKRVSIIRIQQGGKNE
jgi:hypothetical protein